MIVASIIISVLLSIGSAEAGTSPCNNYERLQALINCQGLPVLCAAQGTIAGADSVCAATIGGGWRTEFPTHFGGRTSRENVEQALDWVCANIRSMPQDSSINVIVSLESWVIAYRALEVMEAILGPEAFATAIAFVPSLADLIPRDAELRANLGRGIGSSLASAEYAELLYAVVDRIASLSQEEQAVVIQDLWMATAGE